MRAASSVFPLNHNQINFEEKNNTLQNKNTANKAALLMYGNSGDQKERTKGAEEKCMTSTADSGLLSAVGS